MIGKKFDTCTKKIKKICKLTTRFLKYITMLIFLSKSYTHELQSKFVASHYPFTHPFKKKRSFENKFERPLVSPIGFFFFFFWLNLMECRVRNMQ